jgi:hypothetical protein
VLVFTDIHDKILFTMATVRDLRRKLQEKLPEGHERANLELSLDVVAMGLADSVSSENCYIVVENGKKIPDPELASKTLKRIEG